MTRLGAALTVYRKELRETLRDRRTLVVMVLLPLVLYPLTAVLAAEWLISHEAGRQALPSRVILAGAVDEIGALRPALEDPVTQVQLRLAPDLIVEHGAGTRNLGGADALIVVPKGFANSLAVEAPAPLGIYYDGASDRSRLARERVQAAVTRVAGIERARRLAARGVAPTILQPILVVDVDLATRSRLGRAEVGKLLPFLVIMMVLMGAFYPAIDLTAGEKERGTLEPLLATPVSRQSIVAGKYLAVATISALTGFLNVLCIALAGVWIAVSAARAAGVGLSVGAMAGALPWGAIVMSLGALGLATLLFSGLMIAVASLARNAKEAQVFLTPVYLVATVPAMSATLPGTVLDWGTALVPIANVTLLMKAAITGDLAAGPAVVALVMTALLSAGAIAVAARIYDSERLLYAPEVTGRRRRWRERLRGLFAAGVTGAGTGTGTGAGPGAGAGRADAPLEAGTALALFGSVAALLFFGGALLQQHGLTGIAASQVLLIALPVLLVARAHAGGIRATLALHWPTARQATGAVLIGVSAWYVLALMLTVQERLAPTPPELTRALEQLLDSRGGSVWGYVLALAVAPAICEELLCRGAIARALAKPLGVRGAVVVSAVLFGLLHMSAYRFMPTFLLGLALGTLTLRTGSLIPAMIVHALNNGSLVWLKSEEGAAAERWITEHAAAVAPLALATCAAGFVLTVGPLAYRTVNRPK